MSDILFFFFPRDYNIFWRFFLYFKNSSVFNALIPLYSFLWLNWVIKLPLDWGTVLHIEIIKWGLPENRLLGKYDDTVKIIHSFWFCNSVITLYSYLWYRFFCYLIQILCFFLHSLQMVNTWDRWATLLYIWWLDYFMTWSNYLFSIFLIHLA